MRSDLMHAPIGELDVDELRERYRRSADQWLADVREAQQEAYDYWLRARAEEVAALGRVRRLLFEYARKSVPRDAIEAALAGGDVLSVRPATTRRARIVDVQLPMEGEVAP